MSQSPFVDLVGKGYAGKRVHKYWWTFAPVLPPTIDCPAYKRLKRVWFDQTSGLCKKDESFMPRSPYNEESEEHLVIALFENWALFADYKNCGWADALLKRFGIQTQNIIKVGWSYLFEQEQKEYGIADIVFWFKDEQGEGIVVIEAKKKGGKVNEKDKPNIQNYLDMPAFKDILRKEYRFLVDKSDKSSLAESLGLSNQDVLTWQELGKMQIQAVDLLDEIIPVRDFVKVTLSRRYQHYRIMGASELPPLPHFDDVKNQQTLMFLNSAIIFEDIRNDNLPEMPLAYLQNDLASQMSCIEIYRNSKKRETNVSKQSNKERREILWKMEAF